MFEVDAGRSTILWSKDIYSRSEVIKITGIRAENEIAHVTLDQSRRKV